MDYSNLPNDPDHPAGSDPWRTSPKQSKHTFPPQETGDAPPSPAVEQKTENTHPEQQEDGEAHDDEPPSPEMQDEPPRRNGTWRSTQSDISNSQQIRPDIRFQDQPLTEEELRQKQAYEQKQQERYQQAIHAQQHQRGPGRYHGTGRQGQRPPQYRLQAKITGLERTGKKDPAIRFDVHVWHRL